MHLPEKRILFLLLLLAVLPVSRPLGEPSAYAASETLSVREFERLILEFSERSRYFNTNNLISNETSYLHVIPLLEELGARGQAYLGVGPDQNFTYIAHLQPEIAFIVDVRRDNLLQHLYYKSLFMKAENRWEYLSYLFGKPLPEGFRPDESARASDLVSQFRRFSSDADYFQDNLAEFWEMIRRPAPNLIRKTDAQALKQVATAFFEDNLSLKYRSHGRRPRPYYPSYEQLITETDLKGRPANYLASERHFRFLKKMQEENRIIPVVGDFGGDKALRLVGEFLKEREFKVSAFYLSNVEFYLYRSETFPRFIENVRSLPLDENSLLIRSYFSYWRPHPETVPGYFVTSLLQHAQRFLALVEEDPFINYWDMVSRYYIRNQTPMESP
ncbi:MAG: hypothetical protein ACRD1R_11745 [Acidobacteriota bacterium]